MFYKNFKHFENLFRANKIAVKAFKRSLLFFAPMESKPNECSVVFNSTELYLPDNPELIISLDKVNINGEKKLQTFGSTHC